MCPCIMIMQALDRRKTTLVSTLKIWIWPKFHDGIAPLLENNNDWVLFNDLL